MVSPGQSTASAALRVTVPAVAKRGTRTVIVSVSEQPEEFVTVTSTVDSAVIAEVVYTLPTTSDATTGEPFISNV